MKDYMIESLEKKIDGMHADIKEQLGILRSDISDFKRTCYTNMECHEERIKDIEKFKYQLIGISTAMGVVIGFVVWVLDRFVVPK